MTMEELRRVLQETQQSRKSELLLEDLATGLPIKVQRELAQALTPLSKGDKLPAQYDLASFWERCERALNGLSSNFNVTDLETRHLR